MGGRPNRSQRELTHDLTAMAEAIRPDTKMLFIATE